MSSSETNVIASSEATKFRLLESRTSGIQKAGQSPNDSEDCFARTKHSLAMTIYP